MSYYTIILPAISVVAVFTFVAIAAWSDNRRKERESYYRHETYRKIMEQPGDSAQAVLTVMQHEADLETRKRLDGMKLGGMITLVVGVGLGVFLYFLGLGAPIYLVALIPFLIGLVLTLFGFLVAPRSPSIGPLPPAGPTGH